LATDSSVLAWIAFAVLVPVALLGFTMFAIWYQRRRAPAPAMAAAGGTGGAVVPAGTDGRTPAEQHFPVSVVALHGVLAVTTVVLVFLTAVGVGGS
jgi:hypothetical protein